VPLAIPLLAGPGAISGAILYGTRMRSSGDLGILCGLCLAVGVATFVSLQTAERLRRLLGAHGIDITTRLTGLLIAAIALQLGVEGLVTLIRT
jgi:multiple antibiotic resistance protein